MYSRGEIPPAVGGLTVYVVLSVADFRGDGWHGRRCHWRTDTDLPGDCVSDPEDLLPSKEISFKSKQWAAFGGSQPLGVGKQVPVFLGCLYAAFKRTSLAIGFTGVAVLAARRRLLEEPGASLHFCGISGDEMSTCWSQRP
jgi:hypothetical protein